MPAYPTHTLFSHMALLGLIEASHPLAPAAQAHEGLFRVAGIAGADIQCMPYQVCSRCQAPYRHNQRDSRKCLVCSEEALEDFSLALSDGRQVKRPDIEQDLYRNTHLVLGRRHHPYGVDPDTPPGPPEQPFPDQVVRHLANVLRDARKLAGPREQMAHYYAFTLGWFSHVVSDALFKGVYPQTVQVRFFGHQYHMSMLPAVETLTMTDISHDFGVHWPTWHAQLLDFQPDGGALRHLAMGDPPELYDQKYWTAEFGPPDPAIGRILDVLPPVNRTWFSRMYLTPDYSAPTPILDARQLDQRASWKFNGLDLGAVRAYAISSGWYNNFIKGVEIFLRVVDEATELAGLKDKPLPPAEVEAGHAGTPGWNLWCDAVQTATEKAEHPEAWGSRLDIHPQALQFLKNSTHERVHLVLPKPATDYQSRIAAILRSRWHLKEGDGARTIVIGPPAFNEQAMPALCPEDTLRLKYSLGLSGTITVDPDAEALHIAGLSDFGDQQILDWLQKHSR